MVRRASKYHQQIVVAVDALDECNENRSEFLKLLLGLDKSISLFVTSRKEHDIEDVFQELPSMSLTDLKVRTAADMKTYIDDQLQTCSNLRTLPAKLKEDIQDSFVEKADGM